MFRRTLLAAGLLASFSGLAATMHWDYGKINGPEQWAKDYPHCSAGGFQSPINIVSAATEKTELPPLKFHFDSQPNKIINNGHTIKIKFNKFENILIVGEDTYHLAQFHFHSPSENHIDGKLFAMELHLVFVNKKNQMAVVAVLLDEGTANSTIAALWKQLPKHHEEHAIAENIAIDSLLPTNRAYYAFEGSLTTPPCTHEVKWIVFETPVTVSGEQIMQFRKLYTNNIRPIQALNGRLIQRSET